MSYPTQKDLEEARRRFYELAGLPVPAQGKQVDQYMEAWKQRGAGDATQAFIQMNEARVRQGLPPLGANGQPIEAPVVAPPPPLSIMPTGEVDDFFSAPAGGTKIARRG